MYIYIFHINVYMYIGNNKHTSCAPDTPGLSLRSRGIPSLSIAVHDEQTRFARSRLDFALIFQVSLGPGCFPLDGYKPLGGFHIWRYSGDTPQHAGWFF